MNHAAAIFARPWAMEPTRLLDFAARILHGGSATILQLDKLPDIQQLGYDLTAGVATIAMSGIFIKGGDPILERWGLGIIDTEQVAAAIDDALADDAVERILLSIDSPGGDAAGVEALGDKVYEASKIKPIDAHIADIGASAAYWIASQARTITANATATVGSIGVYMTIWDTSKAAEDDGLKVYLIASGPLKGQGSTGVPVSQEAIDEWQGIIDGMAGYFVKAVARGRRTTQKAIRQLATGAAWLAEDAKANGLIDAVGHLSTALQSPGRLRRSSAETPRQEEPTMADETDKMTPEALREQFADAVKDIEGKASAKAMEHTGDILRAQLAEFGETFAEDPKFAIDRFVAGDTLAEAKAAYADVLKVRLADEAEARKAVEAQLAERDKLVPQTHTDKQKTDAEVEADKKKAETEAKGAPSTWEEAIALVLTELGKASLAGKDLLAARTEAAKIARNRFPDCLGK